MIKGLNLYIWEDVLRDYTPGMMFALAETTAEARELLLKKCSYIPSEDLAKEPLVVENPCAFYCWGGG